MDSYDEFYNQLNVLWQQEQFAEALTLLETKSDQFPDKASDLLLYQVCLLAVLNHRIEAIACFQHALDLGHWYSPLYLSYYDNFLKAIADDCKHLLEISTARFETYRAESQPQLVIQEPRAAPRQLLMILHGNNSNAQDTIRYWDWAVDAGWLVAFPQSSQLNAPERYIWNELATAEAEVKLHYDTLVRAYNLEKFVVGGFSRGAGTAIWATLTGLLPAQGFIGVAPSVFEIEQLAPYIKPSNLRGYILMGEQDKPYRPNVEAMVKRMHECNVICEYHLQADVGHDYPSDFLEKLPLALDFVITGTLSHG